MRKFEKKVVLLIVEGNSEESLLFDRLRDLFEQHSIRFRVYGGDILYDLRRRRKSVKGVIGDTVKEFIAKNKFKTDDIFAVLHIIDTDGCLIGENDVKVDENQGKLTLYNQENISVASEIQRERIIERNKQRSQNINILKTINTILPSHINYRMYYFSRNLEHVLFDEPNPEQATKVSYIDQFVEGLEVPIEEYLSKYMNTTSGNNLNDAYTESWTRIEQNTESLQRFTNVPLLFDFIRLNINSE